MTCFPCPAYSAINLHDCLGLIAGHAYQILLGEEAGRWRCTYYGPPTTDLSPDVQSATVNTLPEARQWLLERCPGGTLKE